MTNQEYNVCVVNDIGSFVAERLGQTYDGAVEYAKAVTHQSLVTALVINRETGEREAYRNGQRF